VLICCTALMTHLAQSGHTEASVRLSAFGAKRTCRQGRERADLTRMTRSWHERVAFAAMHGPDLLYLTRILGLGGSLMRRRSLIFDPPPPSPPLPRLPPGPARYRVARSKRRL
jgi:hypothetical protein